MLDFDLTTSRGSLDSALDEETIGRLADRYERICFPADKIVFQEGEEGDRLYVILRGEMVVLKDMGWGPRELKRARDGEVVGEMSMITGARRTATVRAVRETECVQLGREEFQKLVESDTGFARQMMRMLSERLARSDDRAMEELLNSHRALIFALAEQADSRDPETGAHLQRTRHYCARLSELLLTHPRFEGRVGPGFVESIFHLSPLHDIGKVAIPDAILLKPGKLTPEEYDIMKTHSVQGARCLERALEYSGLESLKMAHRIALYHHEKWDGTGYPEGLKGEDIPIEARVMALADVYDALLSRRVYKEAMGYPEVRDEIRRSAGAHFDPVMAGLMLDHIEEFEAIHARYQDEDEA